MKRIKKAVNSKDGVEYCEGDRVCIYQGRFGHNNIIIIKSLWIDEKTKQVYVCETDSLPGTYLEAIKYKISDKRYNNILKAKNITDNYSNL